MRLLISNLHDYKLSLEEQLNQNKQDFSSLESELQSLKQGFSLSKKQNENLTEEINKKDFEIQILIEKIDNIETNFTIQNQEIKLSYESAMQYLNAEIELHKKSLKQARNTIEDCHRSYIELKDAPKLRQTNENLSAEIMNLQQQLLKLQGLLKETMQKKDQILNENEHLKADNQEIRQENEKIKSDNQDLTSQVIQKEEEGVAFARVQEEVSKYQALITDNDLLKSKNEEMGQNLRLIKGDYEGLLLTMKEKEESLKKAHNNSLETNEKLYHITKISQENTFRFEELQSQNNRLKQEVSDLISANKQLNDSNTQLNAKIKQLAYEHQECFDSQSFEREKILSELELKHRKLLQEHEFMKKDFESHIKGFEMEREAFMREREGILREKKAIKQDFELELEQLEAFNRNLKEALYSHESEINRLKGENEALLNEKERILFELEGEKRNNEHRDHNYRIALSDMENTSHIKREAFNNANIIRENEGIRRMNPLNGEIGRRFNNSKVIRGTGLGLLEFEKGRMGRTGSTFDKRGIDLLKDNERLNEQILRRCREIVGE